jgi:hypothetical protein
MPVARYWDGTAWQDIALGPPAAIRTGVLPTQPVDSQEIMYVADAANGVLWNLRYNAGSASPYKWEFLGGSDAVIESAAVQQATTSTTYADLGTVGPDFTVPLAGDYDIEVAFNGFANVAGTSLWMSYAVGATGALDSDAAVFVEATAGTDVQHASKWKRKTGIAAASLIRAKYRVSGNTGTWRDSNQGGRCMRVRPVRVG